MSPLKAPHTTYIWTGFAMLSHPFYLCFTCVLKKVSHSSAKKACLSEVLYIKHIYLQENKQLVYILEFHWPRIQGNVLSNCFVKFSYQVIPVSFVLTMVFRWQIYPWACLLFARWKILISWNVIWLQAQIWQKNSMYMSKTPQQQRVRSNASRLQWKNG